jgi:hypothetical protein
MSFTSPALSLYCRSFQPGYLDTPVPNELDPGATPDARNTLFSRIGMDPPRVVISKRGGHQLITPVALASEKKVDGLFEYRRSNAPNVLLAVCNGELKEYDNAETFMLLTAGFTPGQPARFVNVKNQVVVMDGTYMRRVATQSTLERSVSLATFPVGFAAPSGAPGLAAVAGPGVTGTYEGFATWYDSVTDHESGPSPVSPSVVFTNQQRQWTKPAGTPPPNVDKWRVYARRVDINEANYYRSGTFSIGATTGTEAVSDLARVTIGPSPIQNLPPPGAFAFMTIFRGYAIGVLPLDTYLNFSAQADFESWSPADRLNVNFGRQHITSVRVLGESCLVQTPTMSFRLEGDRMPFTIVNLHGSYGSIAVDASVEVDAWLYAWDELRGPYRVSRDFGTWQSLADNRIRMLVNTVNALALGEVRCEHDSVRHLVIWSMPMFTATRSRVMMAYDYTIDAWLPPMTGLEVGSLATFTTIFGQVGVYAGDWWGRVYRLFGSTRECVPPGASTVTAPVTGATSDSVTASSAAFYTTGDGMAGQMVAVRSPSNAWQWRRIRSNTATVITLDTTNDAPWTTVPFTDGSWTVYVGAIEWYWTTPFLNFDRSDRVKRGNHLTLMGVLPSATAPIEVLGRVNNEPGTSISLTFTFPAGGAGVWGEGIWGESLWGSSTQHQVYRLRLVRSFRSLQLRMQNFYPDQSVEVFGYILEADWLPRRRVPGVSGG